MKKKGHLVKAPTKRKAPVVDLNETEKYTAKLAMARRSPAASSSAPSAAAGSQEGPPAVSARAPTAAEDPEAAGSGAAAGAAAEDPESVEEIDFTYKCKGQEVIDAAGPENCYFCHLSIMADDVVTVDGAGIVKHESCLGIADAVAAVRKVPATKTLEASELRKKRKLQKAEKALPPSDVEIEQAGAA